MVFKEQDPWFLWWCPHCLLPSRWKVMSTEHWIEHVSTHMIPAVDGK